jgi:hypothetical protein
MGSTHRVSIFDPDGKYITAWRQFGGPTGIYIDDDDVLYATNSLATDDFYMNPLPGWAFDPGVMRGIRIGSVTDGKVTGFIPDPRQMGPAHGAEVAVGIAKATCMSCRKIRYQIRSALCLRNTRKDERTESLWTRTQYLRHTGVIRGVWEAGLCLDGDSSLR